jgi:methyl-accepting chemotaxis protein
MSVKKKLNIAFVTLIIIVFLCLALLLQQFYRIGHQVEETINSQVVQLQIGKEIQRAIASQGMFIRAYVLDPSEFNLDRLNHYNTLLQDEVTKLAAYDNDATFDEYITSLQQATEKILNSGNQAIQVFDQGNEAKALQIINGEFSAANSEIYDLSTSLQDYQQQKLDDVVSNTKATISFSGLSAVKGVEIIENTSVAFSNIRVAIKDVVNQVEEISAASEQISASTEEVTSSVSQIAIGSEQSVSDFEMIAAATEEQAATIEQLNDVSMELSQSAQDLHELIEKFKL